MNRVLKLNEKFSKLPFGKVLFSKAIARMAPYFTTIKPIIEEIEPNRIKVSMRKRASVHNHLKTVHAIAMCNLCEFAAGICTEASIPSHRRWIPIGMEVAYLKKAKTNLVGLCDLGDPKWDEISELECFVSVRDTSDIEVMTALIKMKVSDKPVRS